MTASSITGCTVLILQIKKCRPQVLTDGADGIQSVAGASSWSHSLTRSGIKLGVFSSGRVTL